MKSYPMQKSSKAVFAAVAVVVGVALWFYQKDGWQGVTSYECPYDYHAVQGVSNYIKQEVPVSFETLQERAPAGHRVGAAAEVYGIQFDENGKGFPAYRFIYYAGTAPDAIAASRHHELCHIYEMEVLKVPYVDSYNHAGWVAP